MCKLTVFTATYNRGHLIHRLYESLKRQQIFDFEWLVVDDGSTDNTKVLFENWLKEDNPFVIRYYYQENSGLIRALNKGIDMAHGEFFSKVDSDDYVTDDYAERVVSWLETIESSTDVYAVSGLRVKPDGTPLKGVLPRIPEGEAFVDANDLERAQYDLDADMCEAWKTSVLKKYPFPVWPTEKFAPEQIVLHQIALDGFKIRWYPVAICICEYQEGGLTLGASKLEQENPMGYAMMYNMKLKTDKKFKKQLYNAMQMTALCFVASELSYLKKSNSMLATALTFPLGMMLGIRRKRQYAKIQ